MWSEIIFQQAQSIKKKAVYKALLFLKEQYNNFRSHCKYKKDCNWYRLKIQKMINLQIKIELNLTNFS